MHLFRPKVYRWLMLIFMLHLNNGIIKYNPEKERLLGGYNNGIIVAYWYPEKEKILGA